MPSRAALARHPLAIVGAVIATVSAATFIALAIAAATGLFTNPYAGLVIFIALPAAFVSGLLLIPAGMWLQARLLRRAPGALAEWPVVDLRQPRVRRVVWLVVMLTAVNMVIVLVAGYGTLHWMESPAFCGQTCHTPMHPHFTAWRQGPHASVACVTCHIGEGGAAFVHAKLAGVRQLAHVITGRYPRPIREAAMRPALEVCGTCHVPARDAGDRLRVFREYASDEANTETTTTLRLHVGGAGRPTSSGRAIHWHADPRVRIEYVAADRDRQTIPYVKVTGADGGVREYMAGDATPEQAARGERRQMDCIDCHNVTGHRIWATAEKGVDRAMAEGRISRQLPFIRREAVAIVSRDYPTQEDGLAAIERDLRRFYQPAGHAENAVNDRTLVQTIAALRVVYASNVFPAMKVTWGVYPDHAGHITSLGCFRCHDGAHTAKDGSAIGADCEYCHKDFTSP